MLSITLVCIMLVYHYISMNVSVCQRPNCDRILLQAGSQSVPLVPALGSLLDVAPARACKAHVISVVYIVKYY